MVESSRSLGAEHVMQGKNKCIQNFVGKNFWKVATLSTEKWMGE
jgi:hypothetical protein